MWSERSRAIALCLLLMTLMPLLLTACLNWEEVGEGVAKGQGTAQVKLSEQQTAIAQGVATAVESYEQERGRQGESTCMSAMLPLLFLGLAAAVARSHFGLS